MLRVAKSFADAAHDAEDLVQDSALKALARHEEAVKVTSPSGWLTTITRSTGLQLVRKQKRRNGLDSTVLREFLDWFGQIDVGLGSAATSEGKRRDVVLEAANCLSPALRDVVWCTLIDDMEDDEMAKHLGIADSNVRVRRYRAIRAIREILAETKRTAA